MDDLEWKTRKTLLKWIIWGYHYFWKHPFFRHHTHTQTHKHSRKPTAGGPQDEGLEKVTPALNMAMVTVSIREKFIGCISKHLYHVQNL